MLFLDITQNEDHTIITGDFNSPDINWSTLITSSEFSSTLYNMVFQYNLAQLTGQPTSKKGNILDTVITDHDLSEEISA